MTGRWRAAGLVVLVMGSCAVGATPAGAAADPPPAPPTSPAPDTPAVLGAPSAFDLDATAEDRMAVAAGTRVHERPAPGAGVLAVVDADAELPVIERRSDWVRVRYGSFKGWIWNGTGPEPTAEEAGTGPALEAEVPVPDSGAGPGPGPGPAAPAAGAGPDPATAGRARRLLGGGARAIDAGPWRLLTDVEDPRLLASLERLATDLPTAYRERYGLPIDPAPRTADAERELIVLFAREEAYREFVGDGSGSGPDGFTTNEIAALYRGDLSDNALRMLFVHEGVHLLDWRALGGKAPAWLEEGLAQAMAVSRIEPSGALQAAELDDAARVVTTSLGRDGRRQTVVRLSGGYDAVRRVADGLRRSALPSLEELVASDRSGLADPRLRLLRYSHCALFVRYLLDGEDGRWRDGFHGYLADLARTGDGSPARLVEALRTDWQSLEEGFDRWVLSRDLGLAGPQRPAARPLRQDDRRVEVAAGEPLRERPNPRAGVLAIVDADQELTVLDREGGWVRVRYAGRKGWIALALDETPQEVADETVPDPERLARALDLLGHPSAHPLGPWTLYTDVHGKRLLRSLDRLAGETVRAYEDRFGLDPGLPGSGSGAAAAEEVVILFSRQEEHDAFLGDRALFGAQEIGGSAGFGMAVLHKGDRTAEGFRALLVHELVHLLSRRALGPGTPPWLEEGLADALAFSRITPAGGLHASELGGKTEIWRANPYGLRSQLQQTVASTGPRAAIDRLVAALDRGTLPPLHTLTAMSWTSLVDPRWRQLSYAQSALFVRFLLDADDGRWQQGFRSYLRRIAGGGEAAAGPDALLAALGTDWETLDRSFGRWLRSEQIAARME